VERRLVPVEGRMRARAWVVVRNDLTGNPHNLSENTLTSGGDRYSNPMLFARLTLFSTSLTRLYLSTLKLNVGPPGNLIILNDGATSVRVNAMRCVT